jgi:hypothetical protein
MTIPRLAAIDRTPSAGGSAMHVMNHLSGVDRLANRFTGAS